MKHKVEILGVDELSIRLKANCDLKLAKEVVKKNGLQLQNLMTRNAIFTRGYSTGATKRSIHTGFVDDGLTSETGPTTYYAPYVEMGTRKMSAQPFVRPSFNIQKEKFIKDMEAITK